ncbi:O-methyltransferase mpaG [Paramyrothecium foliicola]|nr:O-methyltransferase mpaG [Paramyrothecium foliicola]
MAHISVDISELQTLATQICLGVTSLGNGGDAERRAVITKCRQLLQGLETPRETMLGHCWAHPATVAAINFGADTGLWTLMDKRGDIPQQVTDLAAVLCVDPRLLSMSRLPSDLFSADTRIWRLMRHLGTMGYLVETAEDEFKPTNLSRSLSIPGIGNGYLAATACVSSALARFHEFSRSRGWKNPSDASDTSLMYAYGINQDMFSWLESQGYGKHFNDLMIGYHEGRKPWMSPDVYPVQERLISGASPDPKEPFLVDIGGNIGHDLLQFKITFPNAPGSLILQDLPVVIRGIKELDPSIVRVEHDFRTEQPIKGARAYYMRSILHDWPDDVCVEILSLIKSAMKQGYSRLLINENVIPSVKAYWEATALDIMMMTLQSSEERTETSWRHLIEDKAGLKVTRIWNDGISTESLIECELC